ncbi:redoxin domain-containing protein [Streptomyces sp. NPDC058195]|uniref:redoxin domain-containing protein n=1 Tax=Streptomyces sp. NPDC058195 TaxID=3346375 RepID=UPI0036EBCB04
MAVLTAVLVLVGFIAFVDLVLTLGVVKRLREHTELLAGAGGMPVTVAVGTEVGDFTAASVDGDVVSSELTPTDTVVAFFSPTCQPCKEKLPKFTAYARSRPGGRSQVLAVVVGSAEEGAEFIERLSPVARVVAEDRQGPLHTAFGTAAYPTLLRVTAEDDGRLVVAENQIDLDQPFPALT